jgi:hypothetical protein
MVDQRDHVQVSMPDLPTLCSYEIGPLDPTQITTMHLPLSSGGTCPLLVPVRVPRSLLITPDFRDGYTYNYLTEEDEEEEWTSSVPRLVNYLYKTLTDTRLYRDLETDEVLPDFLPWQVGWVLRDLTRLTETNDTFALVGMAHLCFLLPLLTQERPSDWPCAETYCAGCLHDRAVKAYRARVRFHREQGKTYDEAQRFALMLSSKGSTLKRA